ncbi:DUF4376 domain-containing protein [Burkholderia ubonensis]|uniref:DUF4376 domain-containing protein n=1 Tax=Burkholderia ubonensis TaxID=101571 RepID=UPI00075D22DB|nr:DUF4376 domain-containing protein [Burkholderia ubonensis]KVT68934.1 hypothetical protein WK54_27310 [Burkholderia ubonensis]
MTTITFEQMGFTSTVTAASAKPATDGYVGSFNGIPYHVHPVATPCAYAALEVAIEAGEVTVDPYVAPTITLAEAQAMQIEQVESSYQAAIDQPVSFKTAGGIIETFDADAGSQLVLMQAAQGYALAGAVPSGFYWVAADNAHVPFELSDLSGLNQVMLAHSWAAFQKRRMLKAQITAATSVAAVRAITWFE